MNYTLLGCGRWGSFIAWYLNKNKNNVTVWGRSGDPIVENLLATRKNDYVEFPEEIELTTDLTYALGKSEYIIISISAQAVRNLMENVSKIEGYKDKKFILCMKGIEDKTGARLSTILIEFGVPQDNIAVWVGPGHIQAFVAGVPSVMVIDSYNPDLSEHLAKTLRSDLIRFYQGQDIIGSEIGAAAKNVMGIAAGLLDGYNFATLKGGLMARGAREISRLIKACGGNEFSAYGLCHLGDYEATLFSKFSHNRMWGEMFAKGEKFEKLAEGVATSSALLHIAKNVNVDLPITQTVYDMIHGNISKDEAIKRLFARDNIREF
ncbi:MAG: glycerol-3-phosphate dehydrogenase [Clostridia bacterium]|nr:glycerol-3-phosphate dehydrogenase [Clostridia bacterium]